MDCVVGIVWSVGGDIEVTDVIEIAAERTTRQSKFQAIKESAIESGDFGLTISRQRVGNAQARRELILKSKFQRDGIGIKSGKVFLFGAKSKIKS